MRVIGLLGEAGAGKSFVADWLRDERRFLQLSFADRMKVYAFECYQIPAVNLWGPSSERGAVIQRTEEEWYPILHKFFPLSEQFIREVMRPNADEYLRGIGGVNPDGSRGGLAGLCALMKEACDHGRFTARLLLQLLGTEWGRALDESMWLNYMFKKTLPSLENGRPLPYLEVLPEAKPQGFSFDARTLPAAGVVIPDHRFENEVKYSLDLGHRVYKVNVEGMPKKPVEGGVDAHASETAVATVTDPRVIPLNLPYGLEQAYKVLEGMFPAGKA